MYDSVPKDALWLVMRKLGVPEVLIDTVKSFHERMEAEIRVGNNMLELHSVRHRQTEFCLVNLPFC